MSNFVTRRLKKLTLKETYVHFFSTLKYALYVMFHPADGFWDLIHAKRGSYSAANFIVILTMLTQAWRLRFTSFVVMNVHWEEVNVFEEFATILPPPGYNLQNRRH
mgnify:FL=1